MITTSRRRTFPPATSTSRRTPSINDDIDRLRLAATSALMTPPRRDHRGHRVVHLRPGSPEDYQAMVVPLRGGPDDDARRFAAAAGRSFSTSGTTSSFARGKFRVRGDCVDLYPAYEEFAYRVEFFGDAIDAHPMINPTSGEMPRGRGADVHLSGQALRAAGDRVERAAWRSRRNWRTGCASLRRRQDARGPAAGGPDEVRHGDAARGGVLLGHRELQPRRCRAGKPGERPFMPDRLFSRTIA